jgi:hypothetical protein
MGLTQMKPNPSILIKITLIAFLLIGMLSCSHIQNTRNIFYSIAYINSDTTDLNYSKLSDKKDLIPLYADQFGKNSTPFDLSAEFKANWSKDGLWIFCKVNDDLFYSDTSNPSKSDALDIFLAPYRGSSDITQLTVLPCNSTDFTKAYIFTKSYRTTDSIRDLKVGTFASSKRNGTKTYFKVLIPLNGLGIIPAINTKIAMQLYVNDSDIKGETLKNQLQW